MDNQICFLMLYLILKALLSAGQVLKLSSIIYYSYINIIYASV